MSKKIVFFFPSFASSEATAPLGILAVATALLRAGYSVKLIDSTITPNYKKRVLEEVQDALCLAAIHRDWEQKVLREVRDALCLGISVLTGPMIRGAVRIAKAVKKEGLSLPVIFGGWHPSLVPGQTLQENYRNCGWGGSSRRL
jgi:anaerobic magnesium-protoporphyrin IX monomethyl ester cyclase